MTALCQCGCGLPAPIAPQSNRSKGWIRGEPRPFRSGHNKRKRERYVVEDCGYSTPCWMWRLFVKANGYGQAYDPAAGCLRQAHRVLYEAVKGPVPEGLDLDHLCRNRACVNPEHLEPVTRSENIRRGYVARREMAEAA